MKVKEHIGKGEFFFQGFVSNFFFDTAPASLDCLLTVWLIGYMFINMRMHI